MTLLTFFGCALTAYGPALAIFFGCIAPNAQYVLLMVSSAFFWLISVLLASAIWYIAKSSQYTIPIIVYTVLLQEIFRWLLYLLINRAEQGLNMVAKHPKSTFNRSGYSFSAGMGFGLMSGIISYISQLSDSVGPGVLMCASCPSLSLYIVSAMTTCLMILHNCAWMMIAFTGFTRRSFTHIIWVIVTHYGVSYLTLLNSSTTKYGCAYSILGSLILLIASAIIVYTDLWKLQQKLA